MYLKVEFKIRPDIRYPAFRLAGYPAKSVSGESLVTVLLFECGLKDHALLYRNDMHCHALLCSTGSQNFY
jgi:hypothetical protein